MATCTVKRSNEMTDSFHIQYTVYLIHKSRNYILLCSPYKWKWQRPTKTWAGSKREKERGREKKSRENRFKKDNDAIKGSGSSISENNQIKRN